MVKVPGRKQRASKAVRGLLDALNTASLNESEEHFLLRRAKEINNEINAALPGFTRQSWEQLTFQAKGALLMRAQHEWDRRVQPPQRD